MVYNWIKETGLAYLSRSSLCRGQSSGYKYGERELL